VGHNAYCVIDNASPGFLEVDLIADVGQLQGEAYHLDIFATDTVRTHARTQRRLPNSRFRSYPDPSVTDMLAPSGSRWPRKGICEDTAP